MQLLKQNQQVPVYQIEPAEPGGSRQFRMYNFIGDLPSQSELLIPHRKDHYLIVFARKITTRHWVDMNSYIPKENAIYFTSPDNIIVKEEFDQLWSTGIAFTPEFLTLNDNGALSKLPIIENPMSAHELIPNEEDIRFIEDLFTKLNAENNSPGEWQQRMLTAYLGVLLTFLSRLYSEQYPNADHSAETVLLKKYQSEIDEHFRELREVGDYASILHISAGHLSEVVKSQSGKPAIKHIHDRVIMEARRLLFHTEGSLKEIAFDLGFADASYFNRFFKRETGSTPADYRTQIREMYH